MLSFLSLKASGYRKLYQTKTGPFYKVILSSSYSVFIFWPIECPEKCDLIHSNSVWLDFQDFIRTEKELK